MIMKKLIVLIMILAPLCLSAQQKLRIMSYNLRFGELSTMQDIGGYIASQAPDFVALQECDWATERERAPHQHGVKFVNELAQATGMFGLYGKTIDYRGGYYGIGILSKYPIVRSERVLLPNDGVTEQRAMLVADILLPGDGVVTMICTHLEVKSRSLRLKQAKFIDRYVRKIKHPVFLAGDFNATPDEPAIGFFNKKWQNLTNDELTYSTYKPSIKIDYIYSRREVELVGTRVCTEARFSDHFPVISDIVLN